MIKSLIEVFGWPSIVLALGQFINFIGIGWSAFRPELPNDSSNPPSTRTIGSLWRRFGLPGLVIACGWLIVTGAAVWSQYEQKVSESEGVREDRDWRKAHADMLTGGDSFPKIYPSTPYQDKDTIELKVRNQGKFPLYDVSVQVRDVTKEHVLLRKFAGETSPEIAMQTSWKRADIQEVENEGRRWRPLGNIPSESTSVVSVGIWHATDPNEQTFLISVQSRNGDGFGKIECAKKDGVWTYESRMGFILEHKASTNYFEAGPIRAQ
jgi:hypothetical protein